VWPSADLAIYVPVLVPRPVLVRKLWFGSGVTSTGNIDIGLYGANGTCLVSSGATAKVNTDQVVNVTDTPIGPGLYYLALVAHTATDTFQRTPATAPMPVALGVFYEAAAYPLPATATFAISQATAYIPLVGMLLEATAV
jgi:hypothetical protein